MKTGFQLLLLTITICTTLQAQEKARVGCIGFYNFENLFDTLDHVEKLDEDFTPNGSLSWNTQKYKEKINNLAKVVSEIGTKTTPDGLAILGVAEIENRSVLEDVVRHPLLVQRKYQIIHYESPDKRGIDVGFLYQPKYFSVSESKAYPLKIFDDNGERVFTRDVLLVGGYFDGAPMYVMVNHWPSRRGGEEASQPLRNAAASLCKHIADSLHQANPKAKVIIMGDLNDDPVSPSVKEVIGAQSKKKKVPPGGFFNPLFKSYRKGLGTLAYRDAWNLFDQLLISQNFLNDPDGYQFYKVGIHNPPYLYQKSGRFKGYPFRTFGGGAYLGGYSDHFPVYLFIIKKV